MDRERRAEQQLDRLMERYPVLAPARGQIWDAYLLMERCYRNGGKILFFGNGGSCADAEHIVGELMKGFCKKRPITEDLFRKITALDPEKGERLARNLQMGLPAISLASETALCTAYANDQDPEMIYAQQVLSYGKPGDVAFGISTSGNSANVLHAFTVARACGLSSIALTGRDGGESAKRADVAIIVPEQETYKIQELHLPVYHALCLMLEDAFFEA